MVRLVRLVSLACLLVYGVAAPVRALAQDAAFTFVVAKRPVQVRVTLKPQNERIAALSALREPAIWSDPVAFPRLDADNGAVQDALAQARAALLKIPEDPKSVRYHYAAGARDRILAA